MAIKIRLTRGGSKKDLFTELLQQTVECQGMGDLLKS